jgi:hypothetical protein
MFLWEDTCNMMVYVHNMIPLRILGDNTLEEAFSGMKPKIDI